MAAVSIIPCILDYFDEDIVRNQILPKNKEVYKANGGDVKIVLAVLACISKILNKLDKMVIVEEVLPILFEVKLADVNVLIRVLGTNSLRQGAHMLPDDSVLQRSPLKCSHKSMSGGIFQLTQ